MSDFVYVAAVGESHGLPLSLIQFRVSSFEFRVLNPDFT